MPSLANPADSQSILDRLSRLQPDMPRRWGRMNAHQVVCHLADSYKVLMGERPAEQKATLLSRTLMRFIALNTPLPWPQGVPTLKEVDQHQEGTRPVEFARDMQELRTLVQRFAATPRDFSFARHPAFGRLTDRELLHWGWRHPDHHLRQFGL